MEIGDSGITSLEKKQDVLADMTEMIALKQYHSLFVISSAGIGKSWVITNTLENQGQETCLINSHCTALQLFRLLYVNRENDLIMFFDDCDGMYSSAVHLGLLRSALYGQPDRIVTYHSSQLPDDLPPSFETLSRFIFCANQTPKKNPMFDAVLTRCLVYRLDISNAEVIEQFRVMTADGYPGVPEHTCSEIIDFIEQHGTERALSMRLLTPAIRIYKFCTDQGSDWHPVLLAQLQNLGRPTSGTKRLNGHAKDARILNEAIAKFPDSSTQQQEWWIEQTRKSRASYYRCLARYRDENALTDTG
jgi:hypothetical protein